MGAMDAPVDVGAQIAAALDPVLVPYGFAPAQVGERPGEVGAVCCCAGADFRRRFGAAFDDADRDEPLWCRDVNVSVVLRGGAWHLDQLRLDGWALDDLLRGVGRADLAPEASGLGSLADPGGPGPLGAMPVADALVRAADLLDLVLGAVDGGRPPLPARGARP